VSTQAGCLPLSPNTHARTRKHNRHLVHTRKRRRTRRVAVAAAVIVVVVVAAVVNAKNERSIDAPIGRHAASIHGGRGRSVATDGGDTIREGILQDALHQTGAHVSLLPAVVGAVGGVGVATEPARCL